MNNCVVVIKENKVFRAQIYDNTRSLKSIFNFKGILNNFKK